MNNKGNPELKYIVNWYYEIRGWNNFNKEFWIKQKHNPMYNYARNMRDAKLAYKYFNENISRIIELLNIMSSEARQNNFDWRITSIIKRHKKINVSS